MNERIPYREVGEQEDAPEPRVDLCKNCIHMRPAYRGAKSGHWKCWSHSKETAMAYVDGSSRRTSESFCENKRKGPTCPDFMVKSESEMKLWWKSWRRFVLTAWAKVVR